MATPVTGRIARVANDSPDPLRFLTDFRDEIQAVVKGQYCRMEILIASGRSPKQISMNVFADEAAEHGLIESEIEKPYFAATFCISLERFKD